MKITQTLKVTKLIKLLTYFLEMKITLLVCQIWFVKLERMQGLQEQI